MTATTDLELVLRKATMGDVPALLALINRYAADKIMLPRTEFEISENLRDFTLAFIGDRLAGCGALHFYSPTHGEIRSLAVDPGLKGSGVGRRLTVALEQEARSFNLHTIFAFTYAQGFFFKMGFAELERGELPLKVWKDCLRCDRFHCCDEVAVAKILVHEKKQTLRLPADLPGVLLPVLR